MLCAKEGIPVPVVLLVMMVPGMFQILVVRVPLLVVAVKVIVILVFCPLMRLEMRGIAQMILLMIDVTVVRVLMSLGVMIRLTYVTRRHQSVVIVIVDVVRIT